MAFLLQCGEKSCQDRRPRRRPKKGAPHSQSAGVLGYTTGGRGGTNSPWHGFTQGPLPPPEVCIKDPTPLLLLLLAGCTPGGPRRETLAIAWLDLGPRGFQGSWEGAGSPSHPPTLAPSPRRTRTAVEGVDPGEARQAPVAKRLHAGDSARQRLLGQMGNPTLIAQQRREGAGGRGAGRGGQTRRPKLQSSGWRKARQGNR